MKHLVLCALTVVLAIAASPVVVQSAASAPMRVGVEVESLDLARGKQLDFAVAVFGEDSCVQRDKATWYRMSDDPTFDTSNDHGVAERHGELLRADRR